MRTLLAISDVLAKVSETVARLGSWLVLPLIFVIVYDVLGRKIPFLQQFVMESWLYDFISPTKLQEMEWHLHAAIFLLAYALAYLNGTHVRVDLWRENRTERTRGWIELLAILVFALPFCGVLVYQSWFFVMKSYVQGEGSASLTGLPHRWVIKSFLLIGTGLLFSALIATLLRLLVYLFGPEELRSAALGRLEMVQLKSSVRETNVSAPK
ncbi:TRAP transporter small permease subunit [Mesorhizobium sp. CAU 1732]|uniref:TRAP transporter small permease subunit n=1 Tax=Mesorhizobium sp. CAU 1732 TaxID=3140358 RepID=UPI00326123F3